MRFLPAIFRFSSLVELDDFVSNREAGSSYKSSKTKRKVNEPDEWVTFDLLVLAFVVGLAVSPEILEGFSGFFCSNVFGPEDGENHIHDQVMEDDFVGRFIFDRINVDGVEDELSVDKEVFVLLNEVGGNSEIQRCWNQGDVGLRAP